jgi:nucleotide-binding universal stress UspA family protein
MTRLILSPFDPAAPGSHMQRMRMLSLIGDEGEERTAAQTAARMRSLHAVLLERLRTDDGTPVEAALELISADDYDALIVGMWATVSDTVPLGSTPASTG